MKETFILFSILLYSFSIKSFSQANSPDHELKIEMKGRGKQYDIEGYKISATLINNSLDTFKYNTMTCSWQRFFCTNNKSLGVLWDVCNHDFPTGVSLPPKSDTTVTFLIYVKHTKITSQTNFRIGMDVIRPGSLSTIYSYNGVTDIKSKGILWSNVTSINP